MEIAICVSLPEKVEEKTFQDVYKIGDRIPFGTIVSEESFSDTGMIDHKNIVKAYTTLDFSCATPSFRPLSYFLSKKKEFDATELKNLECQIGSALHALRTGGCYHGDINCKNSVYTHISVDTIGLTPEGEFVICGFENANLTYYKPNSVPEVQAPEFSKIRESTIDKDVVYMMDLYSLGYQSIY